MERKIPVQKNDEVTLTIAALGSDGQGIGRINNYAVFVPGALPGEAVRAHIIKTTSGYAVGKLLSIETPSAQRVSPPCEAFAQCGGCVLQHLSYPAQLQAKKQVVEDALRKIGHLTDFECEDTLGMEVPWRYRNKGSFPFALGEKGIELGFFAPRSHRLVPLTDCGIQREEVMAAANAVLFWARENKLSAYDEATHRGSLRHCMARVSADGSVMAVVVTHGKLPAREALISTLRARIPGLVSIVHNRNDAHTNVIFGAAFETVWGESCITDTLCGLRFAVSAASFMQVNAVQTEKLYQTACDDLELGGRETVLDLYCGIGTISLLLARRAARVIGVENVRAAVEDARRNAAENGIDNAEFLCDDAARALAQLRAQELHADAIVVDPPRKGCDDAVLQSILASEAKKLVYVSCNPATLARDCAILCAGGFTLQKAQPVDMFPHTAHVETAVLMTK